MENKKEYKQYLPVLLFIVPFIAYLSTQSISFDDRDSVHFSLALEEYNVTLNQPHPPGFPVYIFLGKVIHIFIESPLHSLTFLSALFGALSVFAFFYLIKEIFNEKEAYLSSIILALTPMFWLLSVQALSDIVALFFLIVSLYFFYSFYKNKKNYFFYGGIIISGICFGIRLHTAFILVPLISYILLKNKKKKINFISILLLFLSILLWLIPLIAVQGTTAYLKQSNFLLTSCLKVENLTNLGPSFGEILFEKIKDEGYYFILSSYAINLTKLDIVSSLLLITFILTGLGVFLIQKKKNLRQEWKILLLCSLPYLIMITLMLPAANPRYFLPLLLLTSMIISKGLLKIDKKILLFIFIALLLFQTIPLVIDLHTNLAPPERLIEFVKQKYNPNETIILSSGDLIRHSEYLLKNYTLANVKTEKLYLSGSLPEYENYTHAIYLFDNLRKNIPKNSTLIITFTRNPEIHTKHSIVYLYELNP